MAEAGKPIRGFLASLMRMRGLLRKEVLQIGRDPSSIALALVMPVVLLILFGYGVTFDARDIRVAVVTESSGQLAHDFYSRLEGSPYFLPAHAATLGEAREMLTRREVAAVFHIQDNFDKELLGSHSAPVQVLLDGVDANRARLIAGYAAGVVATFNSTIAREDLQTRAPPIAVLETRLWFNEELDSRRSIVPGLIAMIMTLTGLLLTALVIVREKERGTMEALLVTPVRANEIMLTKLLPYFVLGFAGLGVTMILGRVLFGVPLRGSIGALLLLAALFMLASLGLGLLISAKAPGQMVASQISVVLGFLPALFLSGLLFDIRGQPRWTQVISKIIPTTYFIDASKTLFLAGDFWSALWVDALVLGFMATLLLTLARLKIKKRLE